MGDYRRTSLGKCKKALFTKSLPRSRIGKYIKESDVFQNQDPEKVMRDLEKAQAKLELYEMAINNTSGSNENDQALMKCSLNFGVITKEQ